MRHGISGRKLNRKSSHRKALFKNLTNSLIINEQIKTTLPKAKDLRPIVEKIVTLGKNDTLHAKRKLFAILRDNKTVNKVFNILSKRYAKRNGGYTRVLKSGFRYGDSSPMAIIEFIDRDVNAKGLEDKKRLKEQEKNISENTVSSKGIIKDEFKNEKKELKTEEPEKPQITDNKKIEFEEKDPSSEKVKK